MAMDRTFSPKITRKLYWKSRIKLNEIKEKEEEKKENVWL